MKRHIEGYRSVNQNKHETAWKLIIISMDWPVRAQPVGRGQ